MSEKFVTVKFLGGELMQKTLKELPIKISRRLLREAMGDAVTIWRDEIASRAPKLEQVKLAMKAKNVRIPGDLSRHIVIKLSANSDLEGSAEVGPSKHVYWALFLEFGWKIRQSILPGKRYRRSMRKRAKVVGEVAARRFIEEAYAATKEAVLARFAKRGAEIVSQEAQKHV